MGKGVSAFEAKLVTMESVPLGSGTLKKAHQLRKR
jgi:hypothetical protein